MQKPLKSIGKRISAIIIIAALLTVSLASSGCFPYASFDTGSDGPYEPVPTYAPGTGPELGFALEDNAEPLEIDEYDDYELLGKRYISIYDAGYLDLYFDVPSVSAAECVSHIDENAAIPEKFKELLRIFVRSIEEKYPEADLRPLDLNIRTLEIVECDEYELAIHTLSIDAYGCYVRDENRIYVPKDCEYVPGTWEYQVIMHEFGHAARTVQRSSKDLDLSIELSSSICTIPEEALNSLFTVSLFDYEERDIAYQLQSNMFLILTGCLEGYSLSDYLNHRLSYFAHLLDEQNGNNNYAMSIMKLIEEQRTDYFDENYDRGSEFYYPIYDYLAKMYVDRYASPGMSDEELAALIDELVETVMFDVPEDYDIDTDEFYRFAEEYYGDRQDP